MSQGTTTFAALAPELAGLDDPFKIGKVLWPHYRFFNKQKEIVYSVRDNDETQCVAGNMLGKDFITGFICVGAFLFPHIFLRHPSDPVPLPKRGGLSPTTGKPFVPEVRIVTTSVAEKHLIVLWGEIAGFIQHSTLPLSVDAGGPLLLNHRHIRKVIDGFGNLCPWSYLTGMVYEDPDKMAGHHAPYTLAVADEASGIDDVCWDRMGGWAKRRLAIGNPNDCQNFYRRGVKAGDLPRS